MTARGDFLQALRMGSAKRALDIMDAHNLDPNMKTSLFNGKPLVVVALEGSMGGARDHSFNQWATLKNLIDRGADIDITHKGEALIHSDLLRADTAEVLLENGADVNVRRKSNSKEYPLFKGDTPLHAAIRFKKPDLVQVLLDAGANPNIRNSKGKSAFDEAVGTNSEDLLKAKAASELAIQIMAKESSEGAPSRQELEKPAPAIGVAPAQVIPVAVAQAAMSEEAESNQDSQLTDERPEVPEEPLGAKFSAESEYEPDAEHGTISKDRITEAGEDIPEDIGNQVERVTTEFLREEKHEIESTDVLVEHPLDDGDDEPVLGASIAEGDADRSEDDDDLILGHLDDNPDQKAADEEDEILGALPPTVDVVAAEQESADRSSSVIERLNLIKDIDQSDLEEEEKERLKQTVIEMASIAGVVDVIAARLTKSISMNDCNSLLSAELARSAPKNETPSAASALRDDSAIPFVAPAENRIGAGGQRQVAASPEARGQSIADRVASKISDRLGSAATTACARIADGLGAMQNASKNRSNHQSKLDLLVEKLASQFQAMEGSSEVKQFASIIENDATNFIEKKELAGRAPVAETQESLREINDVLGEIGLLAKKAAGNARNVEEGEKVFAAAKRRVDEIFRSGSEALNLASSEAGNPVSSILKRFHAKISVFIDRMTARLGLSKSLNQEAGQSMSPS